MIWSASMVHKVCFKTVLKRNKSKIPKLYLTVVCIDKCNLYFLQFYSAGSDRLNLVVKDHPR